MNPAFFALGSSFLLLLASEPELALATAATLDSSVSAIAARSARFREGAAEACVRDPVLVIFAPRIRCFYIKTTIGLEGGTGMGSNQNMIKNKPRHS